MLAIGQAGKTGQGFNLLRSSASDDPITIC